MLENLSVRLFKTGFLLFSFSLMMSLALFQSCGGEATYAEGKKLYLKHCANCHMDQGEGLEALYPPLAKSDMLAAAGGAAACWIRNGMEGKILVNGVEYDHKMPENKYLSAIEITNILNYVNNAWGNQRDYITLEEIENALKGCP